VPPSASIKSLAVLMSSGSIFNAAEGFKNVEALNYAGTLNAPR
jgi:hypothetical protein